MSDFLDPNYEVPKGPSNYMKFELGDNKIRILSRPLIGWEYFNNDSKPVRIEGVAKPSVDKKLIKMDKYGKQDLKHFWAMLVWNYNAKELQVLTITQSSIQDTIKSFNKNEDWGDPFKYDITISKTGSGKETTYSVTPIPHKPVSEEIKAAFKEKPCNLRELLKGGDPFSGAKSTPAPAPAPTPAPVQKVIVNEQPRSIIANEGDLPF